MELADVIYDKEKETIPNWTYFDKDTCRILEKNGYLKITNQEILFRGYSF
jgi:hypothetical protein